MKKQTRTRVWDLPLRLFHWLLLIAISVSIYTGLNGGFTEMDYHMLSGYVVLSLVSFRIIWGFIGPKYARFAFFIRPREVIRYTKQLIKGEDEQHLSHNPLGALSVLAFLLSLVIQATTGLFANDDIMVEGPLTHLVSESSSSLLTTIHHYNQWVLFTLIGLHLGAIFFHDVIRKEGLTASMITGIKKGSSNDMRETRFVLEWIIASLTMLTVSAAVYYLINKI